MPDTPVRIGVMIAPLGTGDDSRALKYLILHQNTVQRSFEFQLLPVPVPDDRLIRQLAYDRTPNRNEIEDAMPAFVSRCRQSLDEVATGYKLQPEPAFPIVVLSTATFTDNYYLTGGDDWGIIALGNWQRVMAPPSILEFFLSLLVELSVGFACGGDYPQRHVTTKGCSFDFTAQLADVRFSVLSGFLCSDCLAAISDAHSEQLASDAKVLLQKAWLGTIAEPCDVSVTAKKLGYDLFHTKGVTPTLWERTRATIEEEAVRAILKIIAIVVSAGLLIYLGFRSAG